jgi:hypothetical protein
VREEITNLIAFQKKQDLLLQGKIMKANLTLPQRKWKPQGWQEIPSKAGSSAVLLREEISSLWASATKHGTKTLLITTWNLNKAREKN